MGCTVQKRAGGGRPLLDRLEPRYSLCVGACESYPDWPFGREQIFEVGALCDLGSRCWFKTDCLGAWFDARAESSVVDLDRRRCHPRDFPFHHGTLDTLTNQIEKGDSKWHRTVKYLTSRSRSSSRLFKKPGDLFCFHGATEASRPRAWLSNWVSPMSRRPPQSSSRSGTDTSGLQQRAHRRHFIGDLTHFGCID